MALTAPSSILTYPEQIKVELILRFFNHYFTGKAENKYPIRVYLNVSSSGGVSGRMAYESSLKKYGNTPDHYMYFDGYFSGNKLHLDFNGDSEEWDFTVFQNATGYTLDGNAVSYDHEKNFRIFVTGK